MGNTNPKISVIIPVYNAEKYLRRCVDSILAQIFTDFELLLIDDGSKDKSGEICDEYAKKDNRVKVFHKENGGVSSARNLGLDNARGEWIGFIDSDDMVKPEYLDGLIRCQSRSSLVVGGYECFENSSKKFYITKQCDMDVEDAFNCIGSDSQSGTLLYPWGKLFKAAYIVENNIRFDTTMRLGEDFCFNLDFLSMIEQVSFVPSNNYLYRIGLCRNNRYLMDYDKFHKHVQSFLKCLEGLKEKKNISEKYVKYKILNMYFMYFFSCLKTCSKERMKTECGKFIENEGHAFLNFVIREKSVMHKFYFFSVFYIPFIGYYLLKIFGKSQ